MKQIKNYILSQVAEKKLPKEKALIMLKELFENENQTVKTEDIAVIGMACRFPQAETIEEFWNSLSEGVDLIREFPKERKHDVEIPIRDYFNVADALDIIYRKGAYFDHIDQFDAKFFGISQEEAKLMDPLQRIFLEVTWNALEDAGYSERMLEHSRTGVYVGDTDADYLKLIQNMQPYALPGNTISIIASRISYLLNLSSASNMIDTACSASLAAVHHAIRGLITGDCDMAIAGGINLTLFPVDEGLQDIGIASPDYKIQTFDDGANGTVWGEGCGVVVLKCLEQAKKDHDHIYAVIKGSSMNSDGKTNGITAPNGAAQAELIKEAWRNAGVDPETITYIETHGTATKLGDPIEIEGISKAFEAYTDKKQFCALGALKTNVGHLDTAAGLVGLMKTVLALYHKKIPGLLNFHRPNSFIDFIDMPVYINKKTKEWVVSEGQRRRAGVSAFGLAGTNCHVILEEYNQEQVDCESYNDLKVFTISAKSKEPFENLMKNYLLYFQDAKESFANICYTICCRRGHYQYRLAIQAKSKQDLSKKLLKILLTPRKKRIGLKKEGIWYQENCTLKDDICDKRAFPQIEDRLDAYLDGANVKWEELFENGNYHVSLPVYPFEKKRYWVEYVTEHDYSEFADKPEDIKDYFYEMCWKKETKKTKEVFNWQEKKLWIVLKKDNPLEQAIVECLREKNQKVIEVVQTTNDFSMVADVCTLNPLKQEECKKFCEMIYGLALKLQGIIDFWNFSNHDVATEVVEDVKEYIENDYMGMLTIINCLYNHQKKNPFTLLTVLEGKEPELTHSMDYSMIPAMLKVMAQECSDISYCSITVDHTYQEFTRLADIIITQLVNIQNNRQSNLLITKDGLYTQNLSKMDCSSLPKRELKIKKDGVYIVCGGLGRLGYEMCKYLTDKNPVHLVILGRTNLPERDTWEKTLQSTTIETEKKAIRRIMELERLESSIDYYSADISDKMRMREIIQLVEEKYGKVNGVINMTMNLNETPVVELDNKKMQEDVASKVYGTMVLDELFREQRLDFFILFSSVASIIGGPGLGSYAAGNAFLNQFAFGKDSRETAVLSLIWTDFEAATEKMETGTAQNAAIVYPLSSEEFAKIMDMVCKYQVINPVIARFHKNSLKSALDFFQVNAAEEIFDEEQSITIKKDLINQWKDILEEYDELKEKIENNNTIKEEMKRNVSIGSAIVSFEEKLRSTIESFEYPVDEVQAKVVLIGREVGVYSETEQKIGQIWGEVLGISEVDIYQEFFEIGDSLLLMSVLGRVRNEFHNDLPIEVFYQEPTVAALSERIDEEGMDDTDKITILPRHFSDY